MSLEVNGTKAVLQVQTGGSYSSIVGQLEFNVTYEGAPIDISNKSYNDFIVLMDSELSGKQTTLTGSIVFNNSSYYNGLYDDFILGTERNFRLTWLDGTYINTELQGRVTALSNSLPMGDKVVANITITSEGRNVIQRQNLVDSLGDNLRTSSGEQLTVVKFLQ